MARVKFKTGREIALEDDIQKAIDELDAAWHEMSDIAYTTSNSMSARNTALLAMNMIERTLGLFDYSPRVAQTKTYHE